MWRLANLADDDEIVRLSLALYAEDPAPDPVPEANTRRTLRTFRKEPGRGRAVVLDLEGQVRGYALLVSFWSNELGGEVCTIDELYVCAEHRSQGHSTRLFEALATGTAPFAPAPVALMLETTPDNQRARRLYERLGFVGKNLSMRRRIGR